jgi:predicted lipoprotein with Yx(FWY)xxD motif
MLSIKRMFLGMSMLFIALTVVACGSSSYTTTGGSGGTTPTTASSSSAAIIKTATATVNGNSVTILTNAQGMTLYYFKPDTATNAACTGSCAGNWPPLLFTGPGTPSSATTLPGTLSIVADANGPQVEYNGHPLYRFSGDTAAGQTHGEGILGKWFVATSDLATQSAPQVTPTPYQYGP